MNLSFYPKLACDGINKNKRMYLPYIMTCTGMVMMHYIVNFLQYSESICGLPGIESLKMIINFGGWVIAVFSAIFLFYTNSFLTKQRKKEFGLYNILGMGKRNIGKILFWETIIIYFLSTVIGLLLGIVFSKFGELILLKILDAGIEYNLSVSFDAVKTSVCIFGVIFFLLFLNSMRQIQFSTTAALLKSENAGEKPPKGNWILGIFGAILLGTAYYIAGTIKDPLSALVWFFAAVIMVIIGTYLLMIFGSVLFCRLLQKNKRYYYKANHFVSISSMTYRMKRNGAGLASICILATMVLVMMSSTSSLYFGMEDAIMNTYPKEIDVSCNMDNTEQLSDENIAAIQDVINKTVEIYNTKPRNIYSVRQATITGYLDGNMFDFDVTNQRNRDSINFYDNVIYVKVIPIEDYNAVTGKNEVLNNNEVIICPEGFSFSGNTLSFKHGKSFKVKKTDLDFASKSDEGIDIIPVINVFVSDLSNAVSGVDTLADYNGNRMIHYSYKYNFDTNLPDEKQIALRKAIDNTFPNLSIEESQKFSFEMLNVESRAENRTRDNNIFGGFFFIGSMLSAVFMIAAVLMIYYKQISEGYEDAARFGIMQKVGMTKREIRKSINSQLLTVFFLPLIFAGCHLAFAFNMIRKLLYLFYLNNVSLFAIATAISFVIFALFYTLIYKMTSNAYYKIVSDTKHENR